MIPFRCYVVKSQGLEKFAVISCEYSKNDSISTVRSRHPFILIADSLMIDNSFLLTGKDTLNF